MSIKYLFLLLKFVLNESILQIYNNKHLNILIISHMTKISKKKIKLKHKTKDDSQEDNRDILDVKDNQKKHKITDPVLVAKALIDAQGYEAHAADALGITVKTLRKHIKANDVLIDIKDHILSRQIAFAESQLQDLIALKDLRAIKYFLDSKGKDYGWGKNSTENVQGQKTGVLLINNMTINNSGESLNPTEWSDIVLDQAKDQKKILDQRAKELDLIEDEKQ